MRGLSPVASTPPLLKVPTRIGWDFFCLPPVKTAMTSGASRRPWRDAREVTFCIYKGLQAAGAGSNLVGQRGIENAWTVCLLLITWSRYQ